MALLPGRIEMTEEIISKYYRWLSVVTFIVSIVGPMTLIQAAVGEKILIGLLVNLQFHLAFQFLSRAPFGIYQYIENKNSKIKTVARTAFLFFCWMVMILSVVGFVGFINAALNDYSRFLFTMTFAAIFLGVYSSKTKLHKV